MRKDWRRICGSLAVPCRADSDSNAQRNPVAYTEYIRHLGCLPFSREGMPLIINASLLSVKLKREVWGNVRFPTGHM